MNDQLTLRTRDILLQVLDYTRLTDYTHTHIYREILTDRQTDRQADRQTGRTHVQ